MIVTLIIIGVILLSIVVCIWLLPYEIVVNINKYGYQFLPPDTYWSLNVMGETISHVAVNPSDICNENGVDEQKVKDIIKKLGYNVETCQYEIVHRPIVEITNYTYNDQALINNETIEL